MAVTITNIAILLREEEGGISEFPHSISNTMTPSPYKIVNVDSKIVTATMQNCSYDKHKQNKQVLPCLGEILSF